jgi:hypothetical protein
MLKKMHFFCANFLKDVTSYILPLDASTLNLDREIKMIIFPLALVEPVFLLSLFINGFNLSVVKILQHIYIYIYIHRRFFNCSYIFYFNFFLRNRKSRELNWTVEKITPTL